MGLDCGVTGLICCIAASQMRGLTGASPGGVKDLARRRRKLPQENEPVMLSIIAAGVVFYK
jgi:hypothetical protein